MAQRWPSMRGLGLEPWVPSLRLARRNVTAAGVDRRVEMRATVESLSDAEGFDLVWMPSPFISPHVIDAALARSRTVLRPHGWIVVAINGDDEGDDGALTRLTTATWGGCALGPATATRRLRCAGFAAARALTLPQGPTVVVART